MIGVLAPGSELAGYRIESVVGRGGMGVVYAAREEALARRVALKLLAPDVAADEAFREGFLREMQLAAALEHPHVLPVYAAGEAEGRLYLALRLVEGEDLASLLAREGALPPGRALAVLRQVGEALDAAHAAGLLHRDVKPANVLLAGEHAYLADFGLARSVDSRVSSAGLAGTYAYLAPEVIEGGTPTEAADRYAFACLAYECLAGRPPFVREVEAALLYAHLREPPPPLPDSLAAADAALARGLAKDPENRHPTCAELVQDLESGLRGEARPAPRETVLPAPATPLVGRERELAEAEELLLREDVRLLTLTGPGGTGKTRLALALAERAAPRFRDGARFVALAPVAEPELVLPTVAAALEVSESGGASLAEQLAADLRERELLLVLDNFEQLLAAGPALAELLAEAPGLRLLVSSRSPLRLAAEHEYAVPPLEEREGVELLLERARAHGSAGVPDLHVAAAIVRRVDALPLAIELAAARLRLLGPEALLDRLEQALALLAGGPRDAPARQQTLRATIDWSYRLLEERERSLLTRLSPFAGGFTVEAAEAVAGADLDGLAALVEHNLLRRSGERFQLLHVIRGYALERLAEDGDADAVRRAHALWCLRLCEEVYPDLGGPEERAALAMLELEHDNVRGALRWALDAGDAELGLRIVPAAGWFWFMRGFLSEGRAWIERLLDLPASVPPEVRAAALNRLGNLLLNAGELAGAVARYEECLSIRRDLDDRAGTAAVLTNLGSAVMWLGELEHARSLFEEGLVLAEELGDDTGRAGLLCNLGIIHYELGEYEAAEPPLLESLELARRLGTEWGLAIVLGNLSAVTIARGDPDRGEELVRQSLELHGKLGDDLGVAKSLAGFGDAALARGDVARAVTLIAAAEEAKRRLGAPDAPSKRAQTERQLADARELLPEQAFAAALEEGRRLSLEDAVACAVEP